MRAEIRRMATELFPDSSDSVLYVFDDSEVGEAASPTSPRTVDSPARVERELLDERDERVVRSMRRVLERFRNARDSRERLLAWNDMTRYLIARGSTQHFREEID